MRKPFRTLKARRTDDGVVVMLPPEIAGQLKVIDGGEVIVTWDRDGSISLAPCANDFDRQMAVARQVMRNDRAVLAALAKS